MRRPSGRPSLPPMPHGLQSSFMNIPPNRSHKNLSELDETAKLDKVDLEETEFKEVFGKFLWCEENLHILACACSTMYKIYR